MSHPILRSLISEMVESYLEESEVTAQHLINHMGKVDHDEYTPTKADREHMAKNKPVASHDHGEDGYHSHLYHTKTHSIIHHGEKNPSVHDSYDGHHKIKGHISPENFHKAMKNLNSN